MLNNNNNNGNNCQNIWDQMALSNQLTLHNILNGRNNLGTPQLRAAVASMSEEQKDDALVFLDCNTEELAGFPDVQGMQAIANVCTLLDYLPTELWYFLKIFFFLQFPLISYSRAVTAEDTSLG